MKNNIHKIMGKVFPKIGVQSSNKFVKKSNDNSNWTLSQIIRFLQYQNERVENKEITS